MGEDGGNRADEERMIEPVDQYLRTFSWNKIKYRADRPLPELARMLQEVCTGYCYVEGGYIVVWWRLTRS